MGAVAIIALAYTASISTLALGVAAAILLAMYILNKSGVTALWVYLLLAAALWYAILLSGVHATIAGVLAAAMIPIVKTPGAPDAAHSPLHRLEHAIAPPVAFFIVPLFGFATAGGSLEHMGLDPVHAPLPLGIAPALFLLQPPGIFAPSWLCAPLGFPRPLPGAPC